MTSHSRKHRPDEPLVDTRMRRLYNTLEPNVINNKLLTQTVYEQGPKDEAGKIAKQEGIKFDTVLSLRLDFKNILKISNLRQFRSLTKLQLVHNLIEKIENLDSLVTLEWLDLSFNRIEKIENLENLVRLTDLSLYHNKIETLENLDTLICLNVFSIGKNSIKNLDNVLYLRKFKNLRSLNLAGNPLCLNNEYFYTIFAFFPDLLFLDYKMITKDEHQVSYEKYAIKVEQFNEKEAEKQKKIEEERTTEEARKIHRMAFVEFLDTDRLFEEMIEGDPERKRVFAIIGADELFDAYRERFITICSELFEKGIAEHERRKRDARLFYEVINAAKHDNNQRAKDFIVEFNEYKDDIFEDLNKSNPVGEEEWKKLKELTYNLWNNLMGLEVQMFDQLEDTIKDYMRNLTEMIEYFIEIVNNYFSQLRDIESAHTERLGEHGMIVFEKVLKGEYDEEKLTIFKNLGVFTDKDLLNNSMSYSHEYRLSKIDAWEDNIRKSANKWLDETREYIIKTEEYDRNRNRITEINNFVDNVRSEIENFEIPGINMG